MKTITGTTISDTLFGDFNDNRLEGGLGDDVLYGGFGNDILVGGLGNESLAGGGVMGSRDSLITVGGKDTLIGGVGDDSYLVSAIAGGGSEIRDEGGAFDFNALLIFADLADAEAFTNLSSLESITNPESYGDTAIVLDFPQPGIVGLQKSERDLIIDINRDGVAQTENDLTVVDFFDDQGQLGSSKFALINNIIDPQSIADFFDQPEETIYRFFNNRIGVHFYTASATERDTLLNNPSDFVYENASYLAVDSATENSERAVVYRFFNPTTGAHLYTISETERDSIQENLANFNYEGEAFSAYGSEVAGSIPVYRFFNPTTGAHFYTPSAGERDVVVRDLPNFQSEGIAYYALPIVEDSF